MAVIERRIASHLALESGHAVCGAHGGGVALSDGIACTGCTAIVDAVGRSLSVALAMRLPAGAMYRDPSTEEEDL